jgi:hypothetical protein
MTDDHIANLLDTETEITNICLRTVCDLVRTFLDLVVITSS